MKRRLLLLLFLFLVICLNAQENYELDEIRFTGNNFFSSSVLKQMIISKETPPWYWKSLNSIYSKLGKPPQYFDSSLIPVDMRSLKNYYNDKGFFKTEVSYSYEIDTADKKAVLIYDITENGASQYGRVRLFYKKEIPVYIQDKLYIDLDLDSTYRYDQEKVELEISEAVVYLTNNGFMLAKYDSALVERDTVHARADLFIFIDPGDRLTISGIEINKTGEGSPYISDQMLKEVAAIQPGEFYSREKVGKSQMRLFRTGLFSSISLTGNSEDTSGNSLPLRLSGNIGYLNELSPEIIMDNERSSFNLGLGASYIKRNFFGDARKFTLSSKIGIIDVLNFNFKNIFRKPSDRDSTFQGFLNVTAKLEQPYLFNRPIYGNLELYTNLITILKNSLNSYGGKILFDFEMPYYTFISLLQPFYNIEFVEYTPFLSESDIDLRINSLTSVIGTETGSSKVNDIFFPSSGYNSSFLFEIAVSNTKLKLGGTAFHTLSLPSPSSETAFFYKSQLTNAFYFPLNLRRTIVLAAKLKLGYIQTFKGEEYLIPPNRTFFAGGSNSVRGWRTRELAPDDSIQYYGLTLNSEYGDNLLGGTFLLEGSFEYRIRFLRDFGLTFFADYGNVWNGYSIFRYDKIAVAAGFGLRYFSSIAPFRIDFGFKFYDPEDRKFIFEKQVFKQLEFHFGIGEAF